MDSLLRSKATGSGAARWLNCPASVAMSLNIIEQERDYASEGTRAHETAAKALIDNIPLEDIEDEGVRIYVRTVRETVGPGPIIVEERLPFLGSSGQIDCYAIRGRTCFAADLKYGRGVEIEAKNNEQMAFYACALKDKYPELLKVHFTVVQPNVEDLFEGTASISSWTIPHQSLAKWKRIFEKGLQEVEKAQSIRAGEHCQFCPAKGGCVTYVAYAEVAEREQELLPAEMIPAPGDKWLPEIIPRVARLLLMKQQIQSWFTKAEDFLYSVALQGHPVPGFELYKKRTNRVWNPMFSDEELAKTLKERGVEEPWQKKLLPLTKAEKLCDIKDLIEKPEGAQGLRPIKKNQLDSITE